MEHFLKVVKNMDIITIGKRAKIASKSLLKRSSNEKNYVLQKLIKAIQLNKENIKSVNQIDINYAKKTGLKNSLIERLTITDETLDGIIESLKKVISLEDPIHQILSETSRPNGLIIQKRSVPLGVVAMIYESRPNVTIDAFALTFKTGNSVILKGGKEAINSNQILTDIIQQVLLECKMDPNTIQLFKPTSREQTKELMHCNKYIDVLIPRGSANLIQAVLKESTIPVIETGAGNCHIYIDSEANLEKAILIAYNAKVSRPSVCNSCETILVHQEIAQQFLTRLYNEFNGTVEILGDEVTLSFIKSAKLATDEDYYKEFNDYIVTIKVVKNIEEAILHINTYSTSHSEAIITENIKHAEKFLMEVDSSSVYHNASTRFTDGFEFGFGAEIGISTQKLHVRGPMGLETLTSYKYIIKGDGQIR